jgi:hypothetical protein
LTKLINKRKETVTTPGRVSGYVPGPYYGGYGRYNYPPHYRSWGSYYGRPYDVIYEPPTSQEYVILTIESVLYHLETGKLIWSAQYEMTVEGSVDTMVKNYVTEASKDLKRKKII